MRKKSLCVVYSCGSYSALLSMRKLNYHRKQYNQCISVLQAGSTRLKRGATQVASERSSMRRL